MTYCIGAMLDAGLVIASDSRTHAGADSFASFRKTFSPLTEGAFFMPRYLLFKQ